MKSPIDLSLYLVTSREGLNDMTHFFQIILQAIAGGVRIVQLREKHCSFKEMVAIGNQLLTLLKPREIPLIINDRIDVAQAIKADGVHLGQSDGKIAEARDILGPEAIIGLTVGSFEEASAANLEEIDYLGVGPIFPTKSKPDHSLPIGLDGLKKICLAFQHPIVAIGGIDESNVKQIFDCGVNGVAVISAIFNSVCPKTAAMRMREHGLV